MKAKKIGNTSHISCHYFIGDNCEFVNTGAFFPPTELSTEEQQALLFIFCANLRVNTGAERMGTRGGGDGGWGCVRLGAVK